MQTKKRILIVDDSEINRTMLCKILSEEYYLSQAENGKVALDLLMGQGDTVSAVILDLQMPVMDGYAFLEELKKHKELSAIPVMVATQANDSETEIRVLTMGATDFVSKPYNPSIIRQRLCNILSFSEAAVLRNAVEKDELTGIYNRNAFYQRAGALMHAHPDRQYDIICMDIQRFRLINDMFSQWEGDRLLQYTAAQLTMVVDPSVGICGRLSGDNFVVCIPHDPAGHREIIDVLCSAMAEYHLEIHIVLCFGIYVADNLSIPVSSMCDRANMVIESIKGNFEGGVAYYDDAYRQQILSEQVIVNEMKEALQKDQFVIYGQPKFDFTTFSVVGIEALVRWVHPMRGVIPPDRFIPIFEKNGFIAKLDEYVWDRTCRWMRKWVDEGNEMIPMSINVSRVDIYNPRFCSILEEIVEKYKIPPHMLELEITESAYTDNAEQLIAVTHRLKKMGFVIAMDDFGKGYSSLNMLSEVPTDVLKLDMSLLRGAGDGGKTGNILNFVVSMTKWLEIAVVAEGVETLEQVEFLRSIGCNYGQGYFYAKPLPLHLLESFLKTRNQGGREVGDSPVWGELRQEEIWDPHSQFNLFFNLGFSGMVLCEYDGRNLRITRANNRFYEVIHKKTESEDNDLRVLNVFEYMVDEDRQLLEDVLHRAMREKKVVSCDTRWRYAPEGQVTWLGTKIRLLLTSDQRCVFLASVENVTDRVMNKEELEKQKKKLMRMEASANEKIANQNRVFDAIYDSVSCGIAHLSKDDALRFRWVNRFCCQLLDIPRETVERESPTLWEFVQPEWKDYVQKEIEKLRFLQQGDTLKFLFKIKTRTGLERWTQCHLSHEKNEKGVAVYQGVFTDITEQKNTEEMLRVNEHQLKVAFHHSNLRLSRYNIQTDTLVFPYTDNNLFYSPSYVEHAQDWAKTNDRLHPEDIEKSVGMFERLRAGEPQVEEVLRLKDDQGQYRWIKISYSTIFDEKGRPGMAVGVSRDVSEEMKEREIFIREANKDSLTEVYNRITFQKKVEDVLREEGLGAFIMIDVDNFKNINDTFGHNYGDEVLRRLTNFLKSQFRAEDILGRLGGDEFGVFMRNIPDPQKAVDKGNDICQALYCMEGIKVPLSCSIGVAVCPDNGQDFETLYHHADMAMYRAKNAGKNCCIFFGGEAHGEQERNTSGILTAELQDYVYIAEVPSGRMLYMNAPMLQYCGARFDDWQGKTCYEIFEGRECPCATCTVDGLSYDAYSVSYTKSQATGHTYLIKEKMTHWDGKAAHLCVFIDVTNGEIGDMEELKQ